MNEQFYLDLGVPKDRIHAIQLDVARWRRSHADADAKAVEAYARKVAEETLDDGTRSDVSDR